MSEDTRRNKTDLVLSNGEYAFTQDSTTGSVKVLTGPTVVNVTGQESPVVYDPSIQRFVAVDLEDAAMKSPLAPQGFYIELMNPAENASHPHEGSKEAPPAMLMGQRENIPGPTTFSLWPQQVATVIEGHRLRSNQYVLCRVYDEEAAKANWQKAVLKETAGAADGETQGTISELTEEDLAVGKLFVIKGTQASFYIPPTGVEVVPEEGGAFVRNALTLERLQYCILVDENGDKDYQRGPKVVFPKPTQRFFRDGDGGKVFSPTELNPIQGIHVKVIAPYEEDGRRYAEGEELFITGVETSIYFPRPEHSLIRYDGNAKHFATAVPEGEARYVMDRNTGVIRTVPGPTMLLPDPRTEVIVRRVLSGEECELWYPDNPDAQRYNEALRQLVRRTPSTRSGVSEGDVRRSGKKGKGGRDPQVGLADKSTVSSPAAGAVADEWMRAATFSEPRTLMLDNRYVGVPAVRPFTGYAVMVVSKQGKRRVVEGPANVLLEYDEVLEVLEVSTGTPKSEAAKQRQVYLQLRDNRVVDGIRAICRDHIEVAFDLALRVDFVGEDPTRWFEVTDWVKLLCEEVRSRVRDAARTQPVESVWGDPAAFVRQAVFGENDHRAFAENGMVLVAAEVEGAEVLDAEVARILREAELGRVSSALETDRARTDLEREREMQVILRARAEAQAETERFEAELAAQRIARRIALTEAELDAEVKAQAKKAEEQAARDTVEDARQDKALARKQRAAELETRIGEAKSALSTARLEAETRSAVARFEAAQGPFAEAIQLLGNQDVLAKVAEAVSAQRLFGGKDVASVLSTLFEGTALQDVFTKVERSAVSAPRNGRADK